MKSTIRSALRHPWKVTIDQARAIQLKLCQRVQTRDRLPHPIQRVAGVDVGFENGNTLARAAVVVLSFPGLEPIETAVAKAKVAFPYVPGYLSFREVPVILKALAQLNTAPQLILCDGQGYAHPRRFGIACHLGVLTDLPSIGVAKTRLIGQHKPVPKTKGYWRPLMDHNERIGAVVRTRSNVKPLFVSIGHRVCLQTAIYYTLQCCTRYRLPETTRAAHRLASGV